MLELDRLNEASLSQVVRTVRFRNFPFAVLMAVSKAVIVNVARTISVNLSDRLELRQHQRRPEQQGRVQAATDCESEERSQCWNMNLRLGLTASDIF